MLISGTGDTFFSPKLHVQRTVQRINKAENSFSVASLLAGQNFQYLHISINRDRNQGSLGVHDVDP